MKKKADFHSGKVMHFEQSVWWFVMRKMFFFKIRFTLFFSLIIRPIQWCLFLYSIGYRIVRTR